MSRVYTYSEARQNFASLLEHAMRDGAVRVRRKDGQLFLIVPEESDGSPLNVEGVDIDLSRDEIVDFIQEGRRDYLTTETR
jgi:hypothetical protein